MPKSIGHFGFDGTTGRSDYGGRRTHIIQLLRDSKDPLSVSEVADRVGIHLNTARFHLESLVDSGLAQRTQQPRSTPGRPKILYLGTLPNQTHERAQAYRVLAEALTIAVADNVPDASAIMYSVGKRWGQFVTEAPSEAEHPSDDDLLTRVLTKLDALWFAPELTDDLGQSTRDADQVTGKTNIAPDEEHRFDERGLLFHNCPFADAARSAPEAVCALHAGLLNGSLEELNSTQRTTRIVPLLGQHHCAAPLTTVARGFEDSEGVIVDTRFVSHHASIPSSPAPQ